jgi:hypothetical protein
MRGPLHGGLQVISHNQPKRKQALAQGGAVCPKDAFSEKVFNSFSIGNPQTYPKDCRKY